MPKIELTEEEKQILFFLADYYDKHSEVVEVSKHPQIKGYADLTQLIYRFARYKWAEWATLDQTLIRIYPKAVEKADELRNPPRKDYPKTVVDWFRSKPWSIPFIILPMIFGYVKFIQEVWNWFRAM